MRNTYFLKMDRYLDQALYGNLAERPGGSQDGNRFLHFIENKLKYWDIWYTAS
ncbi:MAG: hypothetical protein H6573_33380 [Lewinellaceae bacterium]|nr:hypothetical protein [Lewinellaceae bacterium]